MTSENYIINIRNKNYIAIIEDDSIHEVAKFTPGSIQIDDERIFYNWDPEMEVEYDNLYSKLNITTLSEVRKTSFNKLYTSKSWLRKQHLDILIK